MNRGISAVNGWLALLALAPAFVASPASAQRADSMLEAQLRAHIAVLASDEFAGREPGTRGESMTLRYLSRQLWDIGLVSGTNDPAHEWFAPVTLVSREPAGSNALFQRRGRRLTVPADSYIVLTSGTRALVTGAPLLFVGRATTVPARNELAGRIAVLLDGRETTSERQNALLAGGAAAVLTVLDGERTLDSVAARRVRSGYALATEQLGGDLEAFITVQAFETLLRGSEHTVAKLRREAEKPGHTAHALGIAATLEATTRETIIRTHNLIAKLPGRRPDGNAVVFMAHWDHFGTCGEPPAEDLICNGAIDNASGLAGWIEIARRLARNPPARDTYFIATTAEELGLLGAQAFAEDPPLPLDQIVAAFNIDSIAIAPRGTPFGIVGLGMTPLEPHLFAAAKAHGRRLRTDEGPNEYVRRQDGWALLQHDVPAVLVSTAYGTPGRMEAFFDSDYHRPSDQPSASLELGGAADDVAFLVALGRWFGDPRKVPEATKSPAK
jgi:hypothetical protein